MTSHTSPGGTWLGRVVRGLWPGHNPLRRRCDRAGAAIAAGILFALVLGIPAAAYAAGHWAHASGLQAMRAEEATRHQTKAVLLGSAHPAKCGASMPARWAAPNGTTHTGTITTMTAVTTGNAAMVWINASGQLTGPPLRHAVVARRAVAAAVLAPVILALVLVGTAALAHRALDRQRLAAWDADWAITEPQWTHRQ